MNFASSSSIVTARGRTVSIARSLYRGELDVLEHAGGPALTALWWGPLVEVRPGDRLRTFPTPLGVMVESVERRVERG